MRLTYKDKYGHWCSDGSKASLQLGNPSENWPSILWGDAVDKLAAYEDAEEQGRLMILPCKVGDKVRDKIADHIFTIQTVELGHRAGTLFRCGNPGTDDYAAFYDFEIGERFDILGHEEAEAALKGEQTDV